MPSPDKKATRVVKLRCPYCKHVYNSSSSRCPNCNRVGLKPNFFPKRVEQAARRERQKNARQAWMVPLPRVTQTAMFMFGRRPFQVVLIVAIVLIGGKLLTERGTSPIARGNARWAQMTRSNLDLLQQALDQFKANCKRYPTTEEGLAALVNDPGVTGWGGPYIVMLKPDPWGQPYRYFSDTQTYMVSSSGPDGAPGSSDDILPAASTNLASPAWTVSTSVLNQAMAAAQSNTLETLSATSPINVEASSTASNISLPASPTVETSAGKTRDDSAGK